MPGYQSISAAAASLKIDEERLLDFRRKGWIEVMVRNDVVFIASDQRYRAKYILHLCATKHLSDEQIQLVLSIQRPPYSLAEVDEILKRNAPASTSKNASG